MPRTRRIGTVLAMLVAGIVIAPIVGCGLFSKSQEQPPEVSQPVAPAAPVPTPAPMSVPPPSLRKAGAEIADEESLKNLIQGKTTKADVRERFGVPQEVVVSPGVETFIYYRDRSSGWFSRTMERVEMLTVRFDVNGLLKDFEYRFSGKK